MVKLSQWIEQINSYFLQTIFFYQLKLLYSSFNKLSVYKYFIEQAIIHSNVYSFSDTDKTNRVSKRS